MLTVKQDALTPDIYMTLRHKVNFQEYAREDVEMALERTLFSVVVFQGDKPVGMGRVVGDGRIAFFIKDVVVDPGYQRQSIGTLVMKTILDYIEARACPNAYVGLMSTPKMEAFYEKFGFVKRPTEDMGHGMVKFVNRMPKHDHNHDVEKEEEVQYDKKAHHLGYGPRD